VAGAAAPSSPQKTGGENISAGAKAAATPETSPSREGTLPASPRAKKLARDLGVDISKVLPNGGRDRIVEEDVRQFAATVKSPPTAADARRRRVIAERLTQSVQTIPHFSLSVEVRADQLVALRESLKGSATASSGVKLTITDLLLKALGIACQENPSMRAAWENGDLRPVNAIDLGLAIAAESGVVAPVVRNAAALQLGGIAKWRSEVAEKARGGRLALTDLEGGIGTLSNLGMYRVTQFQAIISPGQSFILAVGKIDNRPWVEGRGLIVTQTMNLTLSVDHRVADGAVAAKFLESISALIESPERLAR
jgi:pyruvate dehydrogenase E2 component (dihydrolipoamide acetyltransferase)